MGNKKKILILAIVLALFVGPLALTAFNAGDVVINDTIVRPSNPFTVAGAVQVVDTTLALATRLTNPRTTDNMYAGNYESYIIVANVTAAAYTDLANITVILKSATSELISWRWVNTSASMSEVTGASYVTSTMSNATASTYCNLTISFTIDWTCPDTDDLDIRVQSYNTTGTEVNGTKDGNYDIDSDLTLTSSDFIVRSQVEQNSVFEVNTLLYSYEDSGATVFPLAAQTDFYVGRDARTTPPTYDAQYWQADSYSESTGVATWTTDITAKGGIHTETFTLFAITQGGTAGSSASCMGTDGTDSVNILDGPPPAGDGGGIGDALANPDTLTLLVVGGGGIGIVLIGYYYYTGKTAASGGGSRPRKNTTKKKSAPRKKSMTKRRRKR